MRSSVMWQEYVKIRAKHQVIPQTTYPRLKIASEVMVCTCSQQALFWCTVSNISNVRSNWIKTGKHGIISLEHTSWIDQGVHGVSISFSPWMMIFFFGYTSRKLVLVAQLLIGKQWQSSVWV